MLAMRVLVASSSPYRQAMYREAVKKLGHQVVAASTGIECVQELRLLAPDVLVLEAPLFWGGSDGVLEVAEQELGADAFGVIVLAVGSGSIDWFQLSRFRIDDILFRVPTMQELEQAIASVATQQSRGGQSVSWRNRPPGSAAEAHAQSLAWNAVPDPPAGVARQ